MNKNKELLTKEQDEISSSTARWWVFWALGAAVPAGVMAALHPTNSFWAMWTEVTLSTTAGWWYGVIEGAFTGWAVSAFLAWSVLQRTSKTAKWKALWKGMSAVGWVATIAGAISLFSLTGWSMLIAALGWSIALIILNWIIAWKITEVDEIVKNELWEEKAKELFWKIEEETKKKEKIRI